MNLSGLSQEYTGSPIEPIITVTPDISPEEYMITTLYEGSATPPTNVGTYAVEVAASSENYEGTTTDSLEITPALLTISIANDTVTYDGTAKEPEFTTTPAGIAVDFDFSGADPTDAGSYPYTAASADSNYVSSAVSGNLTIEKAAATVNLSGLSQEYTGSPIEPTITVTPDISPEEYMITTLYEGSATPPTNVGTYAVEVAASSGNYEGTTTDSLEITPALLTISIANDTVTYDGTAQEPEFTTDPAGIAVDFNFSGADPTNAGSYPYTAASADSNYVSTAVSGSLTIEKATATVMLSDLTRIYNGSPREVTVAVTPDISPEEYTITTLYEGSATPPTNVGTYAVEVAASSTNYEGEATGELSVVPDDVEITIDDSTFTYDGTAQEPEFTTSPPDIPVAFSYFGREPINTGSYPFTVGSADPNYNGSTEGTLVINKATANVSVENTTQTYTGEALEPNIIITEESASEQFTTTVRYNGSTSLPVNAGTYTVSVETESPNYTGTASSSFTIVPDTVTYTIQDTTFTYNGNPIQPGFTVQPEAANINITFSDNSSSRTNAGTYAFTLSPASSNYVGSKTGTLVINKAEPVITFGSTTQTYTGSGLEPEVSISPNTETYTITTEYDGSPDLPVNAGTYNVSVRAENDNYDATSTVAFTIVPDTVTYTIQDTIFTYDGNPVEPGFTSQPKEADINITFSDNSSSRTNAGTYEFTLSPVSDNYFGSKTGTLTIEKATASIAFSDVSTTYNGNPQSPNITLTPGSETFETTILYNGETDEPVNAGSYEVTVTVSNENYEGSNRKTYTINKAPVNIQVLQDTYTYNGNPFRPGTQTTPTGIPVTVTYDNSGSNPVNAGTYPFTVSSSDNNYSGSTTGTLTINKAAASISFNNLTQTYTGGTLEPSIDISPQSENFNTTVLYDGNPGKPVNAGTYQVDVSAESTNYTGSDSKEFTVLPDNLELEITNNTFTFDSLPKLPEIAVTPAGVALQYDFTGRNAPPEETGTYDFTASSNSPNYLGSISGSITINPSPQEIILNLDEINGYQLQRDTLSLPATATSGLPISYELTDTTNVKFDENDPNLLIFKNVGEVEITANQGGDGNYLPAETVVKGFTIKQQVDISIGDTVFVYNGRTRVIVPEFSFNGEIIPVAQDAALVTYNGEERAPRNAGVYNVKIFFSDENFLGRRQTVLTIQKAPVESIEFVEETLLQVFSDGISEPQVETVPSGIPTDINYDGIPEVPTNAGTYEVEAFVTDNNYTGSVSSQLIIEKGEAGLSVASTAATYNGSPQPVLVSTDPAGLDFKLLYNGSEDIPVNAGTYPFTVNIEHPNYFGTLNDTLIIARSPQKVSFDSLENITYADTTLGLTAESSVGLPVELDILEGDSLVELDGNRLTLLLPGTVSIRAKQAGNENYLPDSVIRSFTILKQEQVITFGGITDKTTIQDTIQLSAGSTNPENPVIFEISEGEGTVVTLSENILSIVGSGAVTLLAYQEGNAFFNASDTVVRSFTIAEEVPRYQITGSLDAAALPESGVIVLYRLEGDQPIQVAQTTISGATYEFSEVERGNYVILVNPGEATFLPTYSGNSLSLGAAETIELTSNQQVDISLYSTPASNNGEASVSGILLFDEEGNGGKVNGNEQSIRGIVVPNTPVFLLNGSALIAYSITNSQGRFSFTQLRQGDYNLGANYENFKPGNNISLELGATDSVQVVLLAANDSISIARSSRLNDALGIEDLVQEGLTFSANPVVHDQYTIGVSNSRWTDAKWILTDLQGRRVKAGQLYPGNNIISMKEYAPGTLMLYVAKGNRRFRLKLIKP